MFSTMRKKSEFTILQRAMQTVHGFDKVYHKMKHLPLLQSSNHAYR